MVTRLPIAEIVLIYDRRAAKDRFEIVQAAPSALQAL
jgi:hypothetical protein